MKLKIAHLYPKELALYGENGNIKALKYALDKENINYEIINVDKEDKLNFKEYDMVYMGSGRKQFLEDVAVRLEPYKEDILEYIKKDKIMLVTGNAVSILKFLDLYEVEEYQERRVSDVVATCSLCQGNILGFQNTEYLIKSTNKILFNIDAGYGNDKTRMEGFMLNNFYVTTLIGPILARNEKLNTYFVGLLKNSL